MRNFSPLTYLFDDVYHCKKVVDDFPHQLLYAILHVWPIRDEELWWQVPYHHVCIVHLPSLPQYQWNMSSFIFYSFKDSVDTTRRHVQIEISLAVIRKSCTNDCLEVDTIIPRLEDVIDFKTIRLLQRVTCSLLEPLQQDDHNVHTTICH